jgi:hypothetical protein
VVTSLKEREGCGGAESGLWWCLKPATDGKEVVTVLKEREGCCGAESRLCLLVQWWCLKPTTERKEREGLTP